MNPSLSFIAFISLNLYIKKSFVLVTNTLRIILQVPLIIESGDKHWLPSMFCHLDTSRSIKFQLLLKPHIRSIKTQFKRMNTIPMKSPATFLECVRVWASERQCICTCELVHADTCVCTFQYVHNGYFRLFCQHTT